MTSDLNLLQLLMKQFPQNSRSSLQKWIRLGKVYVNGQCERKANTLVSEKDQIELKDKTPKRFPFEVLFEDSDLIVVNKPAHLLSVASLDPKEKSVHSYLKKDLKPLKVLPVHRLDKEVCGPLVFSKSQKAYEKLKEAFYHRKVKRHYLALVHGAFEEKEGSFESFLVEDTNYKVHPSKSEGKWSKTHYEVLASNDQASLIRLTLETGRKNQIRVHLKEANHPIIGDDKYGGQKIKNKPIALMAYTLSFKHPINQKVLSFTQEPAAHIKEFAKLYSLKLSL